MDVLAVVCCLGRWGRRQSVAWIGPGSGAPHTCMKQHVGSNCCPCIHDYGVDGELDTSPPGLQDCIIVLLATSSRNGDFGTAIRTKPPARR